jgi:hypothetical protein
MRFARLRGRILRVRSRADGEVGEVGGCIGREDLRCWRRSRLGLRGREVMRLGWEREGGLLRPW